MALEESRRRGEEVVLITPGISGAGEKRYHTTECRYINPKKAVKRERGQVESWGYTQCRECAGARKQPPAEVEQTSIVGTLEKLSPEDLGLGDSE